MHARATKRTHHVVPRGDDGLHVQVAREERDDAVRHDLAVLDEDAPEVAHDRGVVPHLEPRADRDLVAPARDDLRQRTGGSAVGGRPYTRNEGAWTLTSGRNELRVSDMAYVSWTTGVNCSIFGYMSSGESVPEVMTTVLNRSNTGLIAMAGSRQLWQASVSRAAVRRAQCGTTYVRWKIGFGTVAASVSYGSRIRRKPAGQSAGGEDKG